MIGPGKKYDGGKIRWDLVPLTAVEEIAKVLTYGAAKYDANNWQNVAPFEARYFAALQRHLAAWRRGEEVDPESGIRHLAHAGCCLLFLLSKAVGFDPPIGDETRPEPEEPDIWPDHSQFTWPKVDGAKR